MVPILKLIEPKEYTPKYVVSIDPGKTTGTALLSLETGKVIRVFSDGFWECFERITAMPQWWIFVIIESSVTQKHIWQKKGKPNKAAVMGAVGRSIGQNNAQAELLADGFRRRGYYVKTVRPSNTKLKREQVRSITGFESSTNEHNRDAIMIAWAHRNPQVVKAHAESIYKQQAVS